jgi:hippurate hydrolase
LGGAAELRYTRLYPVMINHDAETRIAADVAREIAGARNVDADVKPIMGAEDFAFMLEKRPGAMIFIGNGDTAYCHNPAYDFNDEAIPYGVTFWVRLAETVLKP